MRYYTYGRGFGASRWTQGVRGLIIACGAVFFIQLVAGTEFTFYLGLVPRLVTNNYFLWQLFTYMFLHGGFFHILFNMFVLWMFGSELEGVWGTREFLKYYFITGVGAGILTVITSPTSPIPTVGASGAIYGLLLAFGLLFPERYIYLYFLIPVKAKYLVIIFGVIEFLAAFSGRTSGIAHFAHLGGLLVGFLYLKRRWIRERLVEGIEKRERRRFGPRRGGDESSGDMDAEVDRILRKITSQGMDTLTPEERETLDRASRAYGGPEAED